MYDPQKSETGEDGAFRMIVLSPDNIGGKKIGFEDTVSILTAFAPHYPTKIEISRSDSDDPVLFEVGCSTRVRKPSAISDRSEYTPFCVAKN